MHPSDQVIQLPYSQLTWTGLGHRVSILTLALLRTRQGGWAGPRSMRRTTPLVVYD